MGMNRKSLFSLVFDDGSLFTLPTEWEQVFIAYFGHGSEAHQQIAERLRFVVEKYRGHRAWPSKFDGMLQADRDDDSKYDDPTFYAECWDDWKIERRKWGIRTITNPPTKAEICDAVLYQHMRSGLMQQVLNRMAEEKGIVPPRVITPKQFLEELERQKEKEALKND
jgi:hypothetical protein